MRGPEEGHRERLPKFDLRSNQGWIDSYGTIPYRIRYSITTSDIVSDKDPGRNMITPNTGGGFSLSVFIHKSVPKHFRQAVLLHELKEAEYMYGEERLEQKEAHKKAAQEADSYAQKYLSQDEYRAYKEWKSTLIDPFSVS
ncbi:hypothetical protein GYA28_02490 [Candidatus Roizmanbacteria bacterium]|jgi:hypothetical protein|nr:hypothetical protein [Candidatus Roizmanbacteria bacterium]